MPKKKFRSREGKELMELVHDRVGIIVEEEDRISELPEDIIRIILSFLDMKYVIQFCMLSPKWKHIWPSLTCLNFDTHWFCTLPRFSKFVKKALSERDKLLSEFKKQSDYRKKLSNRSILARRTRLSERNKQYDDKNSCDSNCKDVSAVKLTFTGAASQFVIKSIVEYAYLHNVTQLEVIWSTRKRGEFPKCVFRSRTLKHLILADNRVNPLSSDRFYLRNLVWDFPALESLIVRNIRLGDGHISSLDLFSKCVNLKDLTLHECSMDGLKIFNICAPQLSNLTITDVMGYPKVFNVVAPQLKNVAASVGVSTDRFYLFKTKGLGSLQFSIKRFDCLEKVNLSCLASHCRKEISVPLILELFYKFGSAKFLILDVEIVEALSSCMDQLSLEPSPFNKLECVKINTMHLKQDSTTIPKINTSQIRNYFLESSPEATFIMDLPQLKVPEKTSSKKVPSDTRAKKNAKLEVKKQQQGNMNQKKRMSESKPQMPDQLVAGQKIETEMGNVRHFKRARSNNIQSHPDVHVVELPPMPSPSSTNVTASSNGVLTRSRTRSNRAVQLS